MFIAAMKIFTLVKSRFRFRRGRRKKANFNNSAYLSLSPKPDGSASPMGSTVDADRHGSLRPRRGTTTHSVSYVVRIPDGVGPGGTDTFDVWAGRRVVKLRILPNERQSTMARFIVDELLDSPGVERCGGGQYIVDVPPELDEGGAEAFTVIVEGQRVLVPLPGDIPTVGGSSRRVKISIIPSQSYPCDGMPRARPEREAPETERRNDSRAVEGSAGEYHDRLFELRAPKSVGPGDSITVVVKGMECLVTLPPVLHQAVGRPKRGCSYEDWNERGRRVRFRLPSFFKDEDTIEGAPEAGRSKQRIDFQFCVLVSSAAGGGRWRRAFRASDLRHQWVHMHPGTRMVDRMSGRIVPSADLAARLVRKESVRKWMGGETASSTDVVLVRPADECRYTLLLCLELCAVGRATATAAAGGGGWISGLAELPIDVRGLVLRFAFGGGVGEDSGGDLFSSSPALVRRVTWDGDVGEDESSPPPLCRGGSVDLVPAGDVLFDTRSIHEGGGGGRVSVSTSDLFAASVLPIDNRVSWLREKVGLSGEHIVRFDVRQDHLLEDSVDAVMAMDSTDLRKVWRMRFIGEKNSSLAATQEKWFDLTSNCLFDLGLFEAESCVGCHSRLGCWNIKPLTGESGEPPEGHLLHFRFLGRLLGRALLDGRPIPFRLRWHTYKLLLGWPITLDDIKCKDPEYYDNLVQIVKMPPGDIFYLCLDFATTVSPGPPIREIELVPGGSNIDVTANNLPEYLEACLKYQLFGEVESQSRELVLGFLDVIPEPLLSVFAVDELEGLLFKRAPNQVVFPRPSPARRK